jgi:rhamnulose-1-phosphate aldolase
MKTSIEINSDLHNLFDDISEISRFLWQNGWAERNGGNISVNVTDFISRKTQNLSEFPFQKMERNYPELVGQSFWITATGSRIRNLAHRLNENSGIISITEKGYHCLWTGNPSAFTPTSELASHLRIHQYLIRHSAPEKVILHTHPDELIALTHIPDYLDETVLNRILWGMIPEVKVFVPEGVGFVPYQLPGSEALAEATIKSLDAHKIVLWEKHGCLATGTNIVEAFDSIDVLNKAAKIFLLCKNAGFSPEGLSEEQINELERVYGA